MRIPTLLRVAARLTAVAVVFTVLGCSTGSPDSSIEGPPSPTPSAAPPPPRYALLDGTFCDSAQLHQVPERLRLTIAPLDFSEMSAYQVRDGGETVPRWWAELCRFGAYAEDEHRWANPRGLVVVRIFENRQDAVDHHLEEVESQITHSRNHVTKKITERLVHGWWDEGIRLEQVRERDSFPDSYTIDYHLLHDNLYLNATLFIEPSPEDVDRGIELADELLEALIEEAIQHVPLAVR